MSTNPSRETPTNCPYCGESTKKLPAHLPCAAVPLTEEVLDR